MALMKNEHIVYAFAPLLDGSNLVLVGVTDIGFEYLKQEYGNFLKVEHPLGSDFEKVKQIWIVYSKDKNDIKGMLEKVAEQKGVKLSYPH